MGGIREEGRKNYPSYFKDNEWQCRRHHRRSHTHLRWHLYCSYSSTGTVRVQYGYSTGAHEYLAFISLPLGLPIVGNYGEERKRKKGFGNLRDVALLMMLAPKGRPPELPLACTQSLSEIFWPVSAGG